MANFKKISKINYWIWGDYNIKKHDEVQKKQIKVNIPKEVLLYYFHEIGRFRDTNKLEYIPINVLHSEKDLCKIVYNW